MKTYYADSLLNDFSVDLMFHSENVAKIALGIARCLKINTEEMLVLYGEALYHDIGKSKIPEAILYKKDKLLPDEWDIMKTHAVQSEMLFMGMKRGKEDLKMAKVIRHHHENWDGTGYPDELSKESIPIHSRIIRIADIFDAITHPRIYRPYKINNPFEVIEKMQGKEIDPYIFQDAKEVISTSVF